jgi:hypothetical protein
MIGHVYFKRKINVLLFYFEIIYFEVLIVTLIFLFLNKKGQHIGLDTFRNNE